MRIISSVLFCSLCLTFSPLHAQVVEAALTTASDSADSVMARRMAAEIIEQAAKSSPEFRGTLLDVAKSLRAARMSVAQARDIMSLAASGRQLMMSTAGTSVQQKPANLDRVFAGSSPASAAPSVAPPAVATSSPHSGAEVSTGPVFKPEELDIDSLLIDPPSRKKRTNLFKSRGAAQNPESSGGLAEESLPWEDTQKSPTGARRAGRSKSSNSAKHLGRAQSREMNAVLNVGSVSTTRSGADGLPQTILIRCTAKKLIAKKQTLLVRRKNTVLVKVVVTRLRGDYEALALVMPDTWADGVQRQIRVGDIVQGL